MKMVCRDKIVSFEKIRFSSWVGRENKLQYYYFMLLSIENMKNIGCMNLKFHDNKYQHKQTIEFRKKVVRILGKY